MSSRDYQKQAIPEGKARDLNRIVPRLLSPDPLTGIETPTYPQMSQILRQYSIPITTQEFITIQTNPPKFATLQIYAINNLDPYFQLPVPVELDRVPLASSCYFIMDKDIWDRFLPKLRLIRDTYITNQTVRSEYPTQAPLTAEDILEEATKLLARISTRQEP